MKTRWLVAVVAVAHCIAAGGLVLMQGCGTMREPMAVDEPPEPVMPPPVEQVESVPVTPAPPPVVPDTRSWPTETTTYVVQSGDTLSQIASRYDMSVSEIVALNNLKDPDTIRAGQTLILTGEPGTVTSAPAPEPSGAQPSMPKPVTDIPPGATTYVVKSGDTLSEIAAEYGVTTAALKNANELTSDLIRVGWKLVIPGSAGGSSAPTRPSRDMDLSPGPDEREAPEAGRLPAEEPMIDDAALPMPATGRPAQAPAGELRTHVVEEGEDLYSVAMMWGVSVQRIKELNNLGSDSELEAGDRLKIPVSE